MNNGTSFFDTALWQFGLLPIIRLVLALFFVSIPIGVVQVVVKSINTPVDGMLLFTCLAVPSAFLAYRWYVHLIEKRKASELALTTAPQEFGVGLLIGAALFTTTVGFLWIFGFYHVTGSSSWNVLIGSLTLSVMSGFLEELIARGIIFRILEDVLGTWIALALSALLFGMMHLGNPHATWTSAIAIALEAGLMLGGAYILTRRLWLAIGLHLAWNFTQGGIFGVSVSGTGANGILQSTLTGPDLLSGGAFGAEASVFAVIVCVSGFVIIIARAVKQGRIVQPFWMRKNVASGA